MLLKTKPGQSIVMYLTKKAVDTGLLFSFKKFCWCWKQLCYGCDSCI